MITMGGSKTICRLCLISLLYVQYVIAQAQYCQKPTDAQTNNPNAPPFPNLPSSFQTRIEAAIIDKNYTMSGEEYFDNPNNQASLSLMRSGAIYKLIFDYANDQLFYVQPDQACVVHNLTNDDNNLLFGLSFIKGLPHVFTTSGVLHFAKKFGEQYIGKTQIRGVYVDHWRTCMYWSAVKANFTLDYYFTDQNWVTAAGWPQIPVRAEVTGVMIQSDGTTYKIHHYYDYTDFRAAVYADHTVFETPSGVVCPGRKQTRMIPQLNQAFIYREEIIGTGGVQEVDVYYDDNYSLLRYDFRPSGQWPYGNNDAAAEIHDFNTGVAYAIDKALQNCSIIPIQNGSFDSTINVTKSLSTNAFVMRMKTPKQIFYLDSNFTFEGQRFARGLLCDVFISNRSDFSLGGFMYAAVLEYYFLAMTQTSANNDGNTNPGGSDIPIQLIVTLPTVPQTITYMFYDFDQENPELTVFDISPCFSGADTISFKLTFYGTYDAPVRVYKQLFLFETLNAVAAATGASPLRITSPQFYFQDDKAFFVATLVDAAPVLAKFKQIPGMVLQNHNDISYTSISSAQDCASYCYTNTNFTCLSFDYCPASQICSLSRYGQDDGQTLATNAQCSHYLKTINMNSKPEVPLQTAWMNLKNNVTKGAVQITINFPNKNMQYTASDVSNAITTGQSRNPSAVSTLNQFQLLNNKIVPNYDDLILTGLSVDDCSASCVTEDSFVCSSFEYDYNSGTCYLSHIHPDETPKLIKNQNGFDLYIRDYTAKFSKIAGTTVLSNSDTIYQNIYDENQCAKLCVDYNGFNCKSFDFCTDIGTCFLGKTHYYDAPQVNIKSDLLCNHWSRNYMDDFKKKARYQIPLVNNRIVSGIDASQCAKLCVQEETFSCASFNYCGNLTECRLTTNSIKGGQVIAQSNAYCDLYTRQSFPDGTAYTPNPSKYYNTKPTKSGYTGGSMAGLAIGMIILGIIAAFAGLMIYLKVAHKTTDDVAIQFKRHFNDETDG
ncbi:uncharacterized protein [Mytilus edulis]|uniref:uncharacterized protein isoform X1 n=1 Tax=Mytilus edulis TaxID=6550 RepID=UPI0039F0257B